MNTPTCACGCGQAVERSKVKPHGFNRYIHGHNVRTHPPRAPVPRISRTCRRCGVAFEAKRWYVERGYSVLCSQACYDAERMSTPMPERFWPSVRKTDECWFWIGVVRRNGYGVLTYRTTDGRSPLLAHRVSWTLHNGPIPKGLCVLHRCDVRNCVRPDHLFLGTHKDNAADMWAKGRAPLQQRQTGG